MPSGLEVRQLSVASHRSLVGLPDESVDLDGLHIVQGLERLLDLPLVCLGVDHEDKGVVLLNLLHRTLGVEWVDDDLSGIEARLVWDRAAGILGRARELEGLGEVERCVLSDLRRLVRVDLLYENRPSESCSSDTPLDRRLWWAGAYTAESRFGSSGSLCRWLAGLGVFCQCGQYLRQVGGWKCRCCRDPALALACYHLLPLLALAASFGAIAMFVTAMSCVQLRRSVKLKPRAKWRWKARSGLGALVCACPRVAK